MRNFMHLFAGLTLTAAASGAALAAERELILHGASTLPPWHIAIAGFEGPEKVLRGDAVTIPAPTNSQVPGSSVGARAGEVAGVPQALTLLWKDAWFASLRFDGASPLDLRAYAARGTLEFDLNVLDLDQGGIYFVRPGVLPQATLCGGRAQHAGQGLAAFVVFAGLLCTGQR
jgi:hypothetical protein